MTYIAVMKWGQDGRVEKYLDFPTEAEADAHVLAHGETFPLAFVAPAPNSSFADWLVDGNTLVLSPRPVVVDNTIIARASRRAALQRQSVELELVGDQLGAIKKRLEALEI